ncbi:MAG: helix-hairpin-helix domain-containing protein [Caulobacteraceae bacterium]
MIYMTRTQKSLAAITILAIVIISGTFYIRQEKAVEINLGKGIEAEVKPSPSPTPAEEKVNEIFVYICGEVKKPDVVKVKEGTVLDDAMQLVGGPTEAADLNSINLAYKLCDQDMIKIPKKGEKLTGNEKYAPQANPSQATARKNGKININTASESELDTLSGVGPSTAKAIIKYREQEGPFKAIEEIKNVTGIGESKFNQMKDNITVD